MNLSNSIPSMSMLAPMQMNRFHNMKLHFSSPQDNQCTIYFIIDTTLTTKTSFKVCLVSGGGGGNAIYVPYGDVPPIRVYFLAFVSETGCLFSSLTLKQGAKFVGSLRARVSIHSTVWHPPIGFNLLFVFCSGN